MYMYMYMYMYVIAKVQIKPLTIDVPTVRPAWLKGIVLYRLIGKPDIII